MGSTGNLGSARGRCLNAGSIRRLWRQHMSSSFFILPAQVQDTVFLSCRRSRRTFFSSRYPAGAAAGYCFLLVSSFFLYPAGAAAGSCFLLVSSSYPAGAAAGYCFLLVSSSFFLLLLSFWQHVFFTYFPTSDFDQTWSKWPVAWPLLRHGQWWDQMSRWGHWGQKGHFHQKGIKSFRILSIDAWLMHTHKLDPLYKSYGPKNSLGVIWGHRGQKFIFTKKASSPSE